jgi:hypothetical protein
MKTYKIEIELEVNEEHSLDWVYESIYGQLEDGESISKFRFMLDSIPKTHGQRITNLRKALRGKYGPRNHRITSDDQVYVYSQMPNSIETGWWLLGDFDWAEFYLNLVGFSELDVKGIS